MALRSSSRGSASTRAATTSAKKRAAISPRVFWLASLLFFVSGGTGLAYQVIWFKRFSHVWGSTSLAFAAVGGSFLFGLGLGAFLIGRYADRARSPLWWYGLCELAIGALALVIPFEIAALADASVGLYAAIPQQPGLRYFVQFCITLVVIGPACVLMGGTLPLLMRQLTARDASLDQATGWLYGINTLGAALGCYLAGFHLLPSFGLLWTNNLCAAVNIAIGLVALSFSGAAVGVDRRDAPQKTSPSEATAKLPLSLTLVGLYVGTALAGCAALVLEMTWTRQLALVLGGSTYAFTATLFVVLVGIAAGSLVFHALLKPYASSPWLAVAVVALLVAGTVAGKSALPWLSLAAGREGVRAVRGDQLANGAVCVGISAMVELLPAVAMGILFPLFVHLTHAGAARVGRAVGDIYAANTLGSIAGASLTSLVLFPWIGTAGALALAIAFYVATLLAISPYKGWAAKARAACIAVLGAGAVAWIAQPTDPRLTNLGLYLYGDTIATSAALSSNPDGKSGIATRFFREGASSNVLVTDFGDGVQLRVNGKVDASTGSDMVTQMGIAYLPRIFKPDAKEVAVIGFGSGCTLGKCLLFPDTRVMCCEIEPAAYEASEFFARWNNSPEQKTMAALAARNAQLPPDERLSSDELAEQARLSVVFGDGRTAIQGSDKKYDLIISEPSNPWLAGVSNLFTQEFFRTAREHLTDDGVLAQWIQTYQFTLADYLMIVRTLRTEFPYAAVLTVCLGQDSIMLASKRPLLPTAESVAALQQVVDGVPEIVADLDTWFGGHDLRTMLVMHYRLNEKHLDALVDRDASRALNTDLHLRLEFDAPLHVFRKVPKSEMAGIVTQSAPDPKWADQLARRLGLHPDTSEFQLTVADQLARQMTHPVFAPFLKTSIPLHEASVYTQRAIELDPKSVRGYRTLVRVRLMQGRREEAVGALEQLVALEPGDAKTHAELGMRLLELKRAEPAAGQFREALRLMPTLSHETGNILWANNLAWILATSPYPRLRNGAEAVRWAREVCEVDGYKRGDLMDTLAAALAEAGQFDEAVKITEKQLAVTSQPKAAEAARQRLQLYRSSQPYHEQP